METEKTIKDAVKNKKTVMGRNAVNKMAKAGKLQSVVYSSNCPADFVKELEYYGKLSKVALDKFNGNSAALGQLCGKPFRITILGIEK